MLGCSSPGERGVGLGSGSGLGQGQGQGWVRVSVGVRVQEGWVSKAGLRRERVMLRSTLAAWFGLEMVELGLGIGSVTLDCS